MHLRPSTQPPQARSIAERECQRLRLVDAVERGEISPLDAQVRANDANLGPLTKPGPWRQYCLNRSWTLPMVAAWIVRRNLAAVREFHPDFLFETREWHFLKRFDEGIYTHSLHKKSLPSFFQVLSDHNGVASPLQRLEPVVERDRLLELLRKGKLHADVIVLATGSATRPLDREWSHLEVGFDVRYGDCLFLSGQLSDPKYIEVKFMPEEVQLAWPAIGITEGQVETGRHAKRGAKPKADWGVVKHLLDERISKIGRPDPEHADKKWRSRADAIRWVAGVLQDRNEKVELNTIGERIDKMFPGGICSD